MMRIDLYVFEKLRFQTIRSPFYKLVQSPWKVSNNRVLHGVNTYFYILLSIRNQHKLYLILRNEGEEVKNTFL